MQQKSPCLSPDGSGSERWAMVLGCNICSCFPAPLAEGFLGGGYKHILLIFTMGKWSYLTVAYFSIGLKSPTNQFLLGGNLHVSRIWAWKKAPDSVEFVCFRVSPKDFVVWKFWDWCLVDNGQEVLVLLYLLMNLLETNMLILHT